MANVVHSNIITTVFWVGEEAGSDNGFIPNYASAWDGEWLKHHGGIDDQELRAAGLPLLFKSRENPFYFALPLNDFDDNGVRKAALAALIPWAGSKKWGANESMLKNQWIKITANGKTAYAQWEDVGPFGEDDVGYVLGNAPPANGQLAAAGLDVSPAVQSFLGMGDVGKTTWQFVAAKDVPPGPWKTTVTTSQVHYVDPAKTATAGNDWIVGTIAKETLNGLAGNDSIFASAGDDRADGGTGNDTVYGGTGNDILIGGTGNDVLVGESGSDALYGRSGEDRLFGMAGNDRLTGSGGRDELTGGAGKDVFDFNYLVDSGTTVATRDVIKDFIRGSDKLDLSTLDVSAFMGTRAFSGTGQVRAVQSGSDTIVEINLTGSTVPEMSILVEDVVATALRSSDFIL